MARKDPCGHLVKAHLSFLRSDNAILNTQSTVALVWSSEERRSFDESNISSLLLVFDKQYSYTHICLFTCSGINKKYESIQRSHVRQMVMHKYSSGCCTVQLCWCSRSSFVIVAPHIKHDNVPQVTCLKQKKIEFRTQLRKTVWHCCRCNVKKLM